MLTLVVAVALGVVLGGIALANPDYVVGGVLLLLALAVGLAILFAGVLLVGYWINNPEDFFTFLILPGVFGLAAAILYVTGWLGERWAAQRYALVAQLRGEIEWFRRRWTARRSAGK